LRLGEFRSNFELAQNSELRTFVNCLICLMFKRENFITEFYLVLIEIHNCNNLQ